MNAMEKKKMGKKTEHMKNTKRIKFNEWKKKNNGNVKKKNMGQNNAKKNYNCLPLEMCTVPTT